MAKPTQEQIKYISERFFDEERNTRVGFDGLSKAYGVPGRDEIVEDISMRALSESNEGRAVYSDSYEKKFAFGNDYATAENLHEEKGLTWYHFNDDYITRKLPGVESRFIDII